MTEPSKAMRQVLLASVQGLNLTLVDLAGIDAIVLDAGVVASAGLLANEKVEVFNATTGARFSTMVAISRKAPGAVELTGPAAHFGSPGDRLVVSAWAWLKEKTALKSQPRWVRVDERNRVVPTAAGSSEHPADRPGPKRVGRA